MGFNFTECGRRYFTVCSFLLSFVLCMLQNQTDLAFTTCRRAVHALQCSLHPKFAPHKFDPNAMPPWPQVLSAMARPSFSG